MPGTSKRLMTESPNPPLGRATNPTTRPINTEQQTSAIPNRTISTSTPWIGVGIFILIEANLYPKTTIPAACMTKRKMQRYRIILVVSHTLRPRNAKIGSGVKFHGNPNALPRSIPDRDIDN
mmetsp:Transcript_10845/g.26057  ORF Transcript_10845/g.26057 Transcript_10845/m.26057 type:complete len:122 (+) Transcript_10845:3850-4215(+)